MRLNSKVTWGLAWAGLAVVVAVPSMDFLTGKISGDGNTAAVITSTTDPVRTGSTEPAKTASVTSTLTKTGVIITPAGSPAPAVGDPVDKYLKSGKPLPDYLSDGSAPASPATTQVATIDPVAPIPFPARPADALKVVPPKATVAPADPVVIVDEGAAAPAETIAPSAPIVDSQQASLDGAAPRPPADIVDDSANWQTEDLQQYLDRKGLLDKGSQSSASVTVVERPPAGYDPNGFFLSDGPNNERAARRARLLRMLQDSDPNAPPQSFTLF